MDDERLRRQRNCTRSSFIVLRLHELARHSQHIAHVEVAVTVAI